MIIPRQNYLYNSEEIRKRKVPCTDVPSVTQIWARKPQRRRRNLRADLQRNRKSFPSSFFTSNADDLLETLMPLKTRCTYSSTTNSRLSLAASGTRISATSLQTPQRDILRFTDSPDPISTSEIVDSNPWTEHMLRLINSFKETSINEGSANVTPENLDQGPVFEKSQMDFEKNYLDVVSFTALPSQRKNSHCAENWCFSSDESILRRVSESLKKTDERSFIKKNPVETADKNSYQYASQFKSYKNSLMEKAKRMLNFKTVDPGTTHVERADKVVETVFKRGDRKVRSRKKNLRKKLTKAKIKKSKFIEDSKSLKSSYSISLIDGKLKIVPSQNLLPQVFHLEKSFSAIQFELKDTACSVSLIDKEPISESCYSPKKCLTLYTISKTYISSLEDLNVMGIHFQKPMCLSYFKNGQITNSEISSDTVIPEKKTIQPIKNKLQNTFNLDQGVQVGNQIIPTFRSIGIVASTNKISTKNISTDTSDLAPELRIPSIQNKLKNLPETKNPADINKPNDQSSKWDPKPFNKKCPICNRQEKSNPRYVLPVCTVKGVDQFPRNQNDPWIHVLERVKAKNSCNFSKLKNPADATLANNREQHFDKGLKYINGRMPVNPVNSSYGRRALSTGCSKKLHRNSLVTDITDTNSRLLYVISESPETSSRIKY
ncbi:uncharacterized protein LOC107274547 isoform X2 [Cephus cinctus]|nr:uncharacterized protein LOC107274547 isoform X2 [Cephus cinctus]